MKFFLILFFLVVFVVAGFEVYDLFAQRTSLESEILKLEAQASILEAQNNRLLKDIEYFGHDENLVKEFKSKFNYVEVSESGQKEKLIILVPQQQEPQP